jgi:hypothetical protein
MEEVTKKTSFSQIPETEWWEGQRGLSPRASLSSFFKAKERVWCPDGMFLTEPCLDFLEILIRMGDFR